MMIPRASPNFVAATDVVKRLAGGIGGVRQYALHLSGPKYGTLFSGSEQLKDE
jgi:hypothetical protein